MICYGPRKEGNISALVLMDLSAALHTADHEVLLSALEKKILHKRCDSKVVSRILTTKILQSVCKQYIFK